jgi:hypothetical protein
VVPDVHARDDGQAVCFSTNGQVPYFFSFVDPVDETAGSYIIKISNFVRGPPPAGVFKIPTSCPCAGASGAA